MWKLTLGLSVEEKRHKQCTREVKLHTNPGPSGSSFWGGGSQAAARLFQTHSICSAPVLPLLSAPGHWPRRKSLISSCALWVEGEFSQRGAPAGDGKEMESLLWFCSLRSASEKMTQLPGIQFSCPFLLSVLITLNFAGAISTGASSKGCHQPRVHVPPLGLSPASLLTCNFVVSLFGNKLLRHYPNLTLPSVPMRRVSGALSITGGDSRNESLQGVPRNCDLRHKPRGMASINQNGY